MVVARTPGSTSLLGTAPQELSLQVCGSALDGQVIRLSSPKCTVGSSRECTLRLRAHGVQPLHCLILRGEKQTIVRRVSADTRLNGRTFFDAPLAAGDRLSFGPIEFEVLPASDLRAPLPQPPSAILHTSTDAPVVETGYSLEDRRTLRRRLRNVVRALRTKRSEQAETQKECQRLAERTRVHAAEAEALRQTIESHEQETGTQGDAGSELARLRTSVAELESQLAEQSKQHDLVTAQSQQALDQRSEALAQQTAHLEAARSELQDLLARCAEHESARESLTAEHNALLTSVAGLKQALAEKEEQLGQLQAELTAFSEAAPSKSAHTEALEAELESARKELESARNHWQSSLDSLTRSRDSLRADLERTNRQLATERETWLAQRHELEQAHHQVYEVLEATQLALAKQRAVEADSSFSPEHAAELASLHEQVAFERTKREQEIADQKQQYQAELDALQKQTESLTAEMDTVRQARVQAENLLDEAREQLNQQREHADEDQAREESLHRRQLELEQQAEDLAAQRAALDEQRSALEARQELEEPSEAAPVSSEAPLLFDNAPEEEAVTFESAGENSSNANTELMARLREAMDWNEEENAPESGATDTPTPNLGSLAASPTLDVSIQDSPASAPTNGEEDEESIEDYMSALMERMNTKGQGTTTSKPVAKAAPAPQPTQVPASEPNPLAQSKPEPFDLKPRALPPELTSNLAAMRELANSSARSAIDRSAHRRWGQAALGKLTVGVVAMVCSAILMALSPDYTDVFFLGSCLAMVIAVFWTLQSAVLYRNVLAAKRMQASTGAVDQPNDATSSSSDGLATESGSTGDDVSAE